MRILSKGLFAALTLSLSLGVVACGGKKEEPKKEAATETKKEAKKEAPKAPAADPAVIAKGKEHYTAKCAVCHGESGKGDGVAGKALKPPPRDFTDKAVMASLDDAKLIDTITNGKAGTPMVGFKSQLKEDEIKAVAEYVKTFAK